MKNYKVRSFVHKTTYAPDVGLQQYWWELISKRVTIKTKIEEYCISRIVLFCSYINIPRVKSFFYICNKTCGDKKARIKTSCLILVDLPSGFLCSPMLTHMGHFH